MDPEPGAARPRSHGLYPVLSYREGKPEAMDDLVAEECPIAISYNRRGYAVMLATPLDLEAFALGFSLSEGVIDAPEELEQVAIVDRGDAIELRLRIPAARLSRLPADERVLEGASGCGICGTRDLQRVLRPPRLVTARWPLASEALETAARDLEQRQVLRHATGAVHAAAWADQEGRVRCFAEDVGRHNALDKLIGMLAAQRQPAADGFVLVTSRASYEMVQKSAAAGVPVLAAVSAPTGLAIRLAAAAGMTLIGFTRPPARCVVYAGAERLIGAPQENPS